MDVCRPRSRRKGATQRKRAPADDSGPDSKRRPTAEPCHAEASHDESMITSTRRSDTCRSGALCDLVTLSPILPTTLSEQKQQGSLQQRLLYCESSPVVSRNTDQRSSDILFLSGDDDLFEWDENDMPARPNEKPSSPNIKESHTKRESANDGQNHERINAAVDEKRIEKPAENNDDLWDDDDTFYAQLDLSLLVAQSQKQQQQQTGHGGNSDDIHKTSTENCSESSTSKSRNNVNTDARTSGNDFTASEDRASHVSRTKECGNAIKESSSIDRAKPTLQRMEKSSITSVCVNTKYNHFMSDEHVSRTKQDDQTIGKETPRQEKWFSHLTKDASEHPHVRQETVTRGHNAADDNRTPKVTGSRAHSRLKERLHGNTKVMTTPTSTRLQLLRKAAVEEAMIGLADVESAVKDRDIGPFYGLPRKVQELLDKHRGISQLYEWQDECLSQQAVKEGRNLIYSLPTSGGKTLVAEIIIMQQILCHQKDALLILPFVSIVQEKVTSLTPLAVDLGFLVEEYAGSKGSVPPRKRRNKHALYVCTIEKAHTLVNCMIQEDRMREIGLVVVDELHMVGEGGRRGASLEICLSKLLYLEKCQILGMSATLSNIKDLASFLKAEVYTNTFRPVDLIEYIKLEDNIFQVNPGSNLPEDEKFTHVRTITFPYSKSMLKNDPDHLVGLALEVIPTNSCLFFCATKKNCQNVAENICRYIPRTKAKQLFQHKHKEKEELLLSLRRECDNNLCPTLRRTIPYGAAYHHGGLTMDERKLIEDAYSDGTLCLLAATSTLAAGVNLPAKRVILRSPYIARELLTTSRYKQMVGRAGRAGKDTSGESILIVKPKERKLVSDMLNRPINGCYSSLMHDEGKGMRNLVLSLISLKITRTEGSIQDFIKRTLCGIQAAEFQRNLVELAQNALQQVMDLSLVKKTEDNVLEVTRIGQAAFKGSVDLDMCSTLYDDLKFGCDKGLVLANSLHLLYLVTPYDQIDSARPNWMIYMTQFSSLSDSEHKVAELVGVSEFYMQCKMTGRSSKKFTPALERRAHRFYLTLMLWEMMKRKSIWEVAARFDTPRGFVQTVFTSAASFAFSVQRFCAELEEFWAVHQLLTKLVYDLTYCATTDLMPLLEIPGVKQGRAKQLVMAGYKTLHHLAHADHADLVSKIDYLPIKVAQQIVASAKMALAERIEALTDEAEELTSSPDLSKNTSITK
ncbi:helicase POLQ-like [Strongylocentrotus purpuratus]|uniref:Helicase POLQ-like n=1 Tax=Strongylocentrotus purpuratus TaxID=7668 RepID=A0A7M7NSH9_STRPU|nr:helicase POLQ-like [Strongylocentrotus purpuratus]